MSQGRKFDFEKIFGHASWLPAFAGFIIFAGALGYYIYNTLSAPISANPNSSTVQSTSCNASFVSGNSGEGYIDAAINNYPVSTGLATTDQHAQYAQKTGNSNWKCNIVRVKVPHAEKCFSDTDNLKAIENYAGQTLKLNYVNTADDLFKLSGAEMQKTVIGTSTKAKCVGCPVTDFYAGKQCSESYSELGDNKQKSDLSGNNEGVKSGGEDTVAQKPTTFPSTSPDTIDKTAQRQEGAGATQQQATGGANQPSVTTSAVSTSAPDYKEKFNQCKSEVWQFLKNTSYGSVTQRTKVAWLYARIAGIKSADAKEADYNKCHDILKEIHKIANLDENKATSEAAKPATAQNVPQYIKINISGNSLFSSNNPNLGKSAICAVLMKDGHRKGNAPLYGLTYNMCYTVDSTQKFSLNLKLMQTNYNKDFKQYNFDQVWVYAINTGGIRIARNKLFIMNINSQLDSIVQNAKDTSPKSLNISIGKFYLTGNNEPKTNVDGKETNLFTGTGAVKTTSQLASYVLDATKIDCLNNRSTVP